MSSFTTSVEQNILTLQSATEKYFQKPFLENQCMHTLVNNSLVFMVPFFILPLQYENAPGCSRKRSGVKESGILGFFNAQMPLHLQMCFNMLKKGYMCAEGFAFANKHCSPLEMETIGPSKLFLGKKRITIIY